MAGEHHYVARFAGKLRRHVHHFPLADGRLRLPFINRDVKAVGFQLADDVFARSGQFGRASRARAKLDLLANMLKGALAINCQSG